MKNKFILRIIFLILILCTFATIFSFSSQNGPQSKSVSKMVMRKIVDIYPRTKELNEKEKNAIVEKAQPFIRKTAHFTIYMMVGITIMGFCSTYDLKNNKKLIITLSLGIIYAITDELHQGITGGGRTPRLFDVCIDSLGVLTGAFITLLIIHKMNRINKHKAEKIQ